MRPSEQLDGLKLDNGWTIIGKANRKPTATGGCFSTGYVVEHENGKLGFLKAMDYTEALLSTNTPQMLQMLTEAYLFERNICEKCRDHHLSRVVHAIDAGSILPDPNNPAGKVEYLIFERASGDVRAHLDAMVTLDMVFVLRVLHHAATGLQQLHSAQMAHQDLKPSNVLIFAAAEGAKIGDLGRAWANSLPSPHDSLLLAGDRGYAPPELLYRMVTVRTDLQRRLACDLYHLGSLACFLFSRAHMNSLWTNHLAHEHRPYRWGGSFEEVMPYLKAAFGLALNDVANNLVDYVRGDALEMITQLCEPDPVRRGHPLNRTPGNNPYGLDRYISRLDLLAKRVEIHLK